MSTPLNLTLASASPRRRALLLQAHPHLRCAPANIEELRREGEPPRSFALRMAEEKALALQGELGWVIAGDTVVALGAQVLGKPGSTAEAIQTLSALSGQTHEVWSGWALRGTREGVNQVWRSGVSRAQVTFKALTREEIERYVESGEPMDKAGSYGIQGRGGRLIERFEGSFDGVMGFPTLEVVRALIEEGVLKPESPALLLNSLSIRERMRAAAWRSGRPADEPKLLAVSKFHPPSQLQEAARYGLTDLGESYLQELSEKRAWLAQRPTNPEGGDERRAELTWHYIGALQTNKAKRVGALSHWVHGASRLVELERLAQGARGSLERRRGQPLRVLIQVNLSGEDTKGGVHPDQLPELLQASAELSGLRVEGLMTFPPLGPPESSRPYFQALRRLRDQLATPELPLPHLSMGTSHDFEVAIEEGASWVRVGSALFGERPSAPEP